MRALFVVTSRFDADTPTWDSYRRWSGLTLTELVSLDAMLCPSVLAEILPEDWNHIVNEAHMLSYFTDLECLVQRVGHLHRRNLLAVFRNPDAHPAPPEAQTYQFLFAGYDLVEVGGGPSTLTNCGGFPLAFSNSELSPLGLLPTFDRANEVREALRRHYPSEPHAHCDLWAIYRAVSPDDLPS